MQYSKSKIDKIGKMLIRPDGVSEDELLDAEIVLDEWRQDFVQPLTDVILKCQELLQNEIPSLYIAQRLNKEIEIQLRTFSQHAWAEEIERTSIICKVQLKEGEGPENTLDYFHKTLDVIYEYFYKHRVRKDLQRDIQTGYDSLAELVGEDRQHLLDGFIINERFIKSMEAQE